MTRSGAAPTVIGLGLAFAGPPLIASVGGAPAIGGESPFAELLAQFGLLAICAAVLAIVVLWEGQPLSAVGVRPLRWRSLPSAALLTGFLVLVFSPAVMWLLRLLRFSGFESGVSVLANLPVWYLMLAVVVGGTVEGILYRGYAVERLAELTGSYRIGGPISVVAFALAHVPLWGWGAAAATVLSGGLLTMYYIWTKDLNATIIAHVATDFIGIVVGPLLAALA